MSLVSACLTQSWSPNFFFVGFTTIRCYRKTFKENFFKEKTISRKTNKPNLKKWQKNLVLSLILAHLAQNTGCRLFFPKIWLEVLVSYHHVHNQNKLMIQSWENLVTGGQADEQTDKNDFIGRCQTNVECPIAWFLYKWNSNRKWIYTLYFS